MLDARDVVAFWRDAGPTKWFRGGAAFDRECETQFFDMHFAERTFHQRAHYQPHHFV